MLANVCKFANLRANVTHVFMNDANISPMLPLPRHFLKNDDKAAIGMNLTLGSSFS